MLVFVFILRKRAEIAQKAPEVLAVEMAFRRAVVDPAATARGAEQQILPVILPEVLHADGALRPGFEEIELLFERPGPLLRRLADQIAPSRRHAKGKRRSDAPEAALLVREIRPGHAEEIVEAHSGVLFKVRREIAVEVLREQYIDRFRPCRREDDVGLIKTVGEVEAQAVKARVVVCIPVHSVREHHLHLGMQPVVCGDFFLDLRIPAARARHLDHLDGGEINILRAAVQRDFLAAFRIGQISQVKNLRRGRSDHVDGPGQGGVPPVEQQDVFLSPRGMDALAVHPVVIRSRPEEDLIRCPGMLGAQNSLMLPRRECPELRVRSAREERNSTVILCIETEDAVLRRDGIEAVQIPVQHGELHSRRDNDRPVRPDRSADMVPCFAVHGIPEEGGGGSTAVVLAVQSHAMKEKPVFPLRIVG